MRFYFLICFIMYSLNCLAQVQINGRLFDSISINPISNASLILEKKDIQVGKSLKTVSDINGFFSFRDVPIGESILRILHVGYKSQEILINVKAENQPLQITLIPIDKLLSNVTVAGRRRLIEQNAEKIIYNVENDPVAKAQTTLEILRKVPFVSVDGEDNIQLNGQSNFRVLLNGRETSMFVNNLKEALRAFPSTSISKIEVITTPSAKYDAEGVGGLINIITTKKVEGYNGAASYRVNTNKTAVFNIDFSLKEKKVGFSLNYGGFNSFGQKANVLQQILPKTTGLYASRINNGYGNVYNLNHYGNAELIIDLDSLHYISVYGNLGGGNSRISRKHYLSTDFISQADEQAFFATSSRVLFPSNNFEVDFVKKSRNKKNEFVVRALGDFNTTDNFISSEQNFTNFNRFIYNTSKARSRQYTLQADYSFQLSSALKMEAGAKYIYRNAFSDFVSAVKFNANDNYIIEPSNNDYFNYKQRVSGFFATAAYKRSRIQLQAGTRFERTNIYGDFVTSAKEVSQLYNIFLPNIQFSQMISKSYSYVIAYNKRIERPFIRSLNPFVNRTDTLNLTSGNPDLEPQILHILSLQNRFNLGKFFLGASFFYQYSGNRILLYSVFDDATGVARNTERNIGEEHQWSVNLSLNGRMNDKLNFSITVNPRYNRIRNLFNSLERNSSLTGIYNFNATYSATKKLSINGYIGYSKPLSTIQVENFHNFYFGLVGSFKAYKEKLILTMNIQNWMGADFRYPTRTRSSNFEIEQVIVNPWRNFGFGFVYRFGQLKSDVSKRKGNSNDDLLSN